MTVKRQKVCQHCSKDFITSQYTAKYCTTICRTRSRNTKTASNRIQNLPVSDEWLWVARECRRAGTVEILQGVDLVELFSIHRRRYKCYGWNAEKGTSKFHLCHISPAQGAETVGLLHHLNLFIGSSFANQVHGKKEAIGAGLSVPRASLKSKWLITKSLTDKTILQKVKAYLGSTLVEYANFNAIGKSQRFSIAKKIKENHPSCELKLSELEKMGLQALRTLRAQLEDKELYTVSLTPKRSLVVYLEELERFALQTTDQSKSEEYAFMANAVRCVITWLADQHGQDGFYDVGGPVYGAEFKATALKSGVSGGKLRDFISFQAFQLLQGATLSKSFIKNTLTKYLDVITLDHTDPRCSRDTGHKDFEWVADALNQFCIQVDKNKQALCAMGLVSNELLYYYHESKREALEIASFYESHTFTACDNQWHYPDECYQVESDYIPSRIIAADPDSLWMPF